MKCSCGGKIVSRSIVRDGETTATYSVCTSCASTSNHFPARPKDKNPFEPRSRVWSESEREEYRKKSLPSRN